MLLLFGKLLTSMIKVTSFFISKACLFDFRVFEFILMNIKYRTMVLDMAFDY